VSDLNFNYDEFPYPPHSVNYLPLSDKNLRFSGGTIQISVDYSESKAFTVFLDKQFEEEFVLRVLEAEKRIKKGEGIRFSSVEEMKKHLDEMEE